MPGAWSSLFTLCPLEKAIDDREGTRTEAAKVQVGPPRIEDELVTHHFPKRIIPRRSSALEQVLEVHPFHVTCEGKATDERGTPFEEVFTVHQTTS
jgi:hypothetical protein